MTMRRLIFSILLLAALAAPASAVSPRAYWFQDSRTGWHTMFYIQNIDTTARTATITLYNLMGSSVAATSRTIQPNGFWKFSTTQISGLSDNTDNNDINGQGAVVVTGSAASTIVGNVSIANSTVQTGYNPKWVGISPGAATSFTQE